MIAQDRHTPPYSMKQPLSLAGGHKVPVGHFLKEAVQMLTQVSHTVNTHNNNNNNNSTIGDTAATVASAISNNTEESTDMQDQQQQQQHDLVSTAATSDATVSGSVTWKLNLSPTLMTLDTNIQTVAGLVQVLEQLFANVDPQPTFTHSSSSSSTSSTYSSSNTPSLSLSPSSSSSSSSTYCSSTVSSDRYQMQGIVHAIGEALRLSQVLVVPQNDVFHAVNTIQLMKQCVQVFIMCDGAFFMDVPELLSKTDMVLSSANTTLFSDTTSGRHGGGGDHPLDTLLLLCICSMMIRHVMVHRRGHTAMAAGLAHAYYSQARARLQDLFDVPHVTVLRSMFILSVFPHTHLDLFSPSRIGSTLLTSATRMALAMNLDQLDNTTASSMEESDHGGSEEKERRRRLAWMILCADHFADVNRTGQTGRIDATHWHVDFPTPMDGENNNNNNTSRRVELFSHYCRIVMIRKMQLFRSAYMVVSQSPKALTANMDQKLFDSYTNTPDHLTLSLDLDTDAHLTRQWKKFDVEPLLIETLHCNTLIMALVPFLPRRYLATFEQGCVSREAIIKDIYQHTKQQALLAKLSITPIPPATPLNPHSNDKNRKDTNAATHTILPESLEMHTVIECLTIANRLSFVLEVLGFVDSVYCHHQPTQAMLLLVHVYEMIQTNCQQSDVATVCRLNLIRAFRLIQQVRRVDPDLALVYLERMATSYIGTSSDDSSSSLERTTASLLLRLRQSSLYQPPPLTDSGSATTSATTSLSSTTGVETRNIKLESV